MGQTFYNGGIFNGCKDEERPPIHGFQWPQDGKMRVCFVQCGPDLEESVGTSWRNRREAELLVTALANFLNAGEHKRWGLSPKDVAAITGYSAQKDLLKQLIQAQLGGAVAHKVRVDTVDGFQGMERELVLVSATRCNTIGEVGFLKDARRTNVLLTRARRGLIVFGDSTTLCHEREVWQPWLQFVHTHGAYFDIERFLHS